MSWTGLDDETKTGKSIPSEVILSEILLIHHSFGLSFVLSSKQKLFLMLVLGIETSCDETAIAFLEVKSRLPRPTFRVLSNLISSQVKLHAKFGGVVPSLAARKHSENLAKVFRLALAEAKLKKKPDLIAVTRGPGLAPALLTGVNFAKTLAYFLNRPIVGVNHLEGHLFSNWLGPVGEELPLPFVLKEKNKTRVKEKTPASFPAIVLLVSGGHTELILMRDFGHYQLLGQTLDDAAGECFDKVARLLNLGYPGGPVIDQLARQGNPRAFTFPSPLIHSRDYHFSFSGLKTALLYFLRKTQLELKEKKEKQLLADIAASFQEAVVKVLIKKTLKAAEEFKAKSIFVCGGVAANRYLRESFLAQVKTVPVNFPLRSYVTDNAAMIALAGFFRFQQGEASADFEVEANLNLG